MNSNNNQSKTAVVATVLCVFPFGRSCSRNAHFFFFFFCVLDIFIRTHTHTHIRGRDGVVGGGIRGILLFYILSCDVCVSLPPERTHKSLYLHRGPINTTEIDPAIFIFFFFFLSLFLCRNIMYGCDQVICLYNPKK